ncbi:hypothetical protein DACRYDRAFT_19738 [Dacryopinax primogenitus]|uniref:Uncharacterized protein n=1 Tax=Dacryopinax primogenitus (strain DJM 731) TaxID=1858805 RepID=M5G4F3_DACPD|nr:uncharacterized protein DACRYDRAFT_19738 [Dacryopinax primogenitus]EJU05141.1 hypothetical protein DACRYDRAFT_19738 [Dacryopinax primogenitus]
MPVLYYPAPSIIWRDMTSRSSPTALPNADVDDPQPSFIHFSTLALILISISVFLVLTLVPVLVCLARRQGKIPKLAISKPRQRESACPIVYTSYSTADLRVLPGLPDPPSFAGRFEYYNASGGMVSLKDVIVEDEKPGFLKTSDRPHLLDQNAISPVTLTFSPALRRNDSSISDGLSDYSKSQAIASLRDSDIMSYYLNTTKASLGLPSPLSPAYSARDPFRAFQTRRIKPPSADISRTPSEFSVSINGDGLSEHTQVHRRYSGSSHRIPNAPPRIPTLVGLDAFSTIGTAMMKPTSPSIGTTVIQSPQPPQPAFQPVMSYKSSKFDQDTTRSHFSPPTPLLSPMPEEPRRGSDFSFSRFYGSYAPITPQPATGQMPRSQTLGEKFKHRRFSSEVNARFAVGLGLDLSGRAGYI